MHSGMFGRTRSLFSAQAAEMQRNVKRLEPDAMRKMFPPSQIESWPAGYIPAAGVAYFLRPEGVPLVDIIDAHRDTKTDKEHELQRDFASDYTLWCRCTLLQFSKQLRERSDQRLARLFKKYSSRGRALRDSQVRQLYQLPPFKPHREGFELVPATGGNIPGATPGSPLPKDGEMGMEKPFYEFLPYAATQEYAMLPVSNAKSETFRVHLQSYPQIRNILFTDFDSLYALRAFSAYTGDDIIPTQELLQTVSFYLQRRLDAIFSQEDTFLAGSSNPPRRVDYGKEGIPVLCCFGNGRFSFLLSETGIVRSSIVSVQLPQQEKHRSRQLQSLLSQSKSTDSTLLSELHVDAGGMCSPFPVETSSIGDALRKFKPAIVIVEPHVDRDYLCDIRGFYSVREVLVFGTVDSPAMCSFAFPFLSFGVTPGPASYWVYNENLQRVARANQIQMPVDPPHELQGYKKFYCDDISSQLISPNDCPSMNAQYRCVSFRRTVCPIMKAESQ